MKTNVEKSIIKTLSYFDIFDYPLTLSEIRKYNELLLEISDEELLGLILNIPIIQQSHGFFYFLGRSEIVNKRLERNDVSIQKFGKARIISNILSKIPTIEYIGVSGSLSMNNSLIGDDIDLFFITKKNTLWITRFFVNLALILIRQKRAKRKSNSKDKICPNMFLERGRLALPHTRENLYTAHEIVQLKTLYDKRNAYGSFLNANRWVLNFLPNVQMSISRKNKKHKKKLLSLLKPFEVIFYFAQKVYMRKNRANEIVLSHIAMFHPINKEKIILDLYEIKTQKYINLYEDDMWIDSEEARFYFDEKKIRILN